MAEPTEGRYDNTKTVKENVDADFRRVKDAYDKEGAAAGNEKLVSETQGTALTGASAEQQRQYQEEMAKQLKAAGILPEISVAAVLKNPGDVIKGNVVDETALGRAQYNAKDPLQAAMLRGFGDKYQALKAENANQPNYAGGEFGSMPTDFPVTKQQLERTLADSRTTATERTALQDKQKQDKVDLSELVTNPKLFNALADKEGKIYKGSIDEFNKKFFAPGTEGEQFRAQFGDKAAQDRVVATTEALKKKFDDPKNQDDKPGSVLKENSAGVLPWNWFNKGDFMTKDTLAKGLGYTKPDGSPDVESMNKKLPVDISVQTKPRAEVPSVTDYNNTAQGRGDGPYQVAQRMLGGDQQKFFKNPAEAQAIMTDVLRQPNIWKQDRQGVPKVTAENRDAIAAAIKEREAKIAKDGGKPENNDLSSWFASRYPKLEAPAKPAEAQVQPAADFAASKVIKGQGSDAISRKMVEGQGLDDGARKALQGVIGNKAITGVDLTSARTGTDVINAGNLEKVREAIEKANNPQLTAWFNKRYPKKA
jgi:hypothetical protein